MQNFLNIISWGLKTLSEKFFTSMQVDENSPAEAEESAILRTVKEIYKTHGALWETVNILGVRNERDPDEWNDFFIVVIQDRVFKFIGTTDPGKYYTNKPMDPNGCFHMALGFHKHIWKIGLHGGKYPALVQTGAPVRGWRDKNKNFLDDDNIKEIKTSSIHFHHGGSTAGNIGVYSAGCQVVKNIEDLEQILSEIGETNQKKFSYLLILLEHCPNVLKELIPGRVA